MKVFKNVLSIICYLLYLVIPLICIYFLRDNYTVIITFLVFLFLFYLKDNYFKGLKFCLPFDFILIFLITLVVSGFNFTLALDITTGFCLASLAPLVLVLIGIHLFFLVKCKDPFYFLRKEFILNSSNKKLIETMNKYLPEGFFDHIINRK